MSESNMAKTVSKTLDEVMNLLPDKTLKEFSNAFEPDTSDIPEISAEEYDLMDRYTELNLTLCGIIRSLLKHNNMSIEDAKSKMGSLGAETINSIIRSERVPISNSRLMISISLLLMDRKIKIPGTVGKTLKALAKSSA